MVLHSERIGFRAYLLAFVLGFACCGVVAKFVLPAPVGAASRAAFALANPADVVAQVGDSVVTLEAFPLTTAASASEEPLWQRFFTPSVTEPSSVASGVIFTSDGYIVTNSHVVEGAGKIRVRLADEREFQARVMGRDEHSDLAVLKIPARGLHPARLGDARHLRPGEPVVAIGNPLGFEHSVSLGIVSAVRTGPLRVDGATLGDMIQTDAAINQGNSGGGLFTATGELIGINTAIMVPRGGSGSIGIGFAIPIHRVEPVVESLIRYGKVRRPWLGIRYRSRRSEGLVRRVRHGAGVVVEGVLPDSPAWRAGLRPYDVIRQLGDCKIMSADDMYCFIERYPPGTSVQARILRAGQEVELTLNLDERSHP